MLNWIGHELAALSLHTMYSFSFDMAEQTWKLVLVMDDLRNIEFNIEEFPVMDVENTMQRLV